MINLFIVMILISILVVIIDVDLVTRRQLKLQESIFKLIRNRYSHDVIKLLNYKKHHKK